MAKAKRRRGRRAKPAKTKAEAARENGTKGGRPRRQLDPQERDFFDAMCGAGALEADIAEVLKVDRKTLDTICKRDYGMGFSAYRQQKLGAGRAKLAAKQLQLALDGNVVMCIWLGKQWLDQREPTHRVEATGKDGGPIEGKLVTEVIFVSSDGKGSPKH